MTESVGASTPTGGRSDKVTFYSRLVKEVQGIVEFPSKRLAPAANAIINLSNVAASLFYGLNRHANPEAVLQSPPVNWLGFYLMHGPELLALGPFQGRPACTEIKMGRGVCGTAAQQAKTLVVSDVHEFPGHIACDSASNSEIVVPIKSATGEVVGIIDVDSTQVNFFDDVDAQGLQEVAEIVAKHVDFSVFHQFCTQMPLAGTGPSAPEKPTANVGAGSETQPSVLPSNDGTDKNIKDKVCLTGSAVAALCASGLAAKAVTLPPSCKLSAATIMPLSNHAVQGQREASLEEGRPLVQASPRRWSVDISGWEFEATDFTRILTQEELKQYEEELGIGSIPELQFPFNTLHITPVARHGKVPLLSFSLKDLLRAAAAYYKTESYRETTVPQLVIPVSETWKRTPYAVFDAKVDWAWRNDFFGFDKSSCTLKPLEPTMPGLNWDLLRDRTLPILFFHNFDMLEDDLHDHGVVKSSVRIRAMPTAFFILHRHFIRIDHYRIWIRDVRIFHQYEVRRENGEPHIVVREEVRLLDINNDVQWSEKDSDECAQLAKLESEQEYYVSFDRDSAGRGWWNTINTS